VAALGDVYERWDGAGEPAHKRGDEVALAARVTSIAFVVEVFLRTAGPAAVVRELGLRRGGQLDPHLVDAYSIGHSEAVASLAQKVAGQARLPAAEVDKLRTAALLHDLGIVSVPNGILDAPRALARTERERVELHAHHTERILCRCALLEPFAALAASHHESLDGSGYPRSRAKTSLDVASRILAVCDVATALGEERAYRPARSREEAGRVLLDEARAGRLDRQAVEWTLAVLGVDARMPDAAGPDGLSAREVEVLCHLTRGRSNKEIGARLFISPRTVQQHVRHIYEKTRVSTRAAAALYATEHDLVARFADVPRLR
jgi:HD-GYP domain-containing protein (c-di-GMP phosphodiesterase class II)/DNA-binding CsgD family transcriptional regulator